VSMSIRSGVAVVLFPFLTFFAPAPSTATSAAGATAPAPVSLKPYFGYFESNTTTTIVTRPDSVIASVTLRSNGVPQDGVLVELWAKPFERPWRKVGSDDTGSSGSARVSHSPTYNTTYMWKFAGNEQLAAGSSSYLTGKVRVSVTLRLEDPSVPAGHAVVARGWVRPIKAGTYATMWRQSTSGSTKLGRGLIRSDGSYRIRYVGPRGESSVHVTVPAVSGNLGGKSLSRSMSIY
jgi:hypothetical protein